MTVDELEIRLELLVSWNKPSHSLGSGTWVEACDKGLEFARPRFAN